MVSRSGVRLLTDQQERTVCVAYLCDVRLAYLKERYGVAVPTMRLIKDSRSYRWGDSLVEFYRKATRGERKANAIHLYLAFNGKEARPRGTVNRNLHAGAYRIVAGRIFLPEEREIIDEMGLESLAIPRNEMDFLLMGLWGETSAEELVRPFILDRLEEEYQYVREPDIGKVYRDVKTVVSDKIRRGGLGMTERKEKLVLEVLETLPARDREILMARYGIKKRKRILEDIGRRLNVTGERVRQLEKKSLKRLMDYSSYSRLAVLRGIATDQDVDKYLDRIGRLERSRRHPILDFPPDVLTQSPRILDVLEEEGVKTVEGILRLTGKDLLARQNFGEGSLCFLRSRLAQYGLSLDQEGDKKEPREPIRLTALALS